MTPAPIGNQNQRCCLGFDVTALTRLFGGLRGCMLDELIKRLGCNRIGR